MTTAPSDRGGPTALPRVAHRVIIAALVLSQLLQQPGRQTFDTKLDLTVDPARLLEGSLHLWNPLLSFGELQNQAYGYLFPMGSFFLLGDAVGLPPWLVQRAWSALVLVAAFEGARRLHRALSPSVPTGLWLVTGLAYALAPRTLGLVGVLSAEALPAARAARGSRCHSSMLCPAATRQRERRASRGSRFCSWAGSTQRQQ